MKQFQSQRELISTIIPCYNQGQFLQDAIDSVLAQKYPQIEIIIVNDGSTDPQTNRIIKNLTQQKLPYLKIFTLKNRGLAGARNYGLRKAQGDFIQFLDADDQLLPQKFTRQLQQFSQNPTLDISYTKFYFLYHDQQIIRPPLNSLVLKEPVADLLFRWEMSLSLAPACFLFKSDCLQQYHFNANFFSCEDWVLWSELALAGYQFGFCDLWGVVYRQHADSMTKNRDRMYLANVLATAHLRSLIKTDQDLVRDFDQAATSRLKYVFYQYFSDELIKNNPDRQELTQIKSAKFFKVWQGYNAILKKLKLKN
jgi:glycosyltransferase involved in cell wall biosynthesis